MNKINWSVAILDVITIIVAVIGYMTNNNILPAYAEILGLVSFTLTTIAAVGLWLVHLMKSILGVGCGTSN